MRAPILLTAACLGLSACPAQLDDGSPTATAGTAARAQCSPLDGVYQFSYSLRSGNCGPQPDELLQFANGRSKPSPSVSCQAGGEAMVTVCDLQRDSMCAVSDPISGALIGHVHVTGMLTESPDYTRVTGSLDVAILDTSGSSCQGTYDVVGTRR
jgi:hypothetical protein